MCIIFREGSTANGRPPAMRGSEPATLKSKRHDLIPLTIARTNPFLVPLPLHSHLLSPISCLLNLLSRNSFSPKNSGFPEVGNPCALFMSPKDNNHCFPRNFALILNEFRSILPLYVCVSPKRSNSNYQDFVDTFLHILENYTVISLYSIADDSTRLGVSLICFGLASTVNITTRVNALIDIIFVNSQNIFYTSCRSSIG